MSRSMRGTGRALGRLLGLAGMALVLAACGSLPLGRSEPRGMDLYIVRHAQTVANVTKDYSPKNQRTFSPQGKREIRALSAELERLPIDHVLVSPTVRTLRTIAPYLMRTGIQAEVWPELEECCWQKDRSSPPSVERPRGDLIRIDPVLSPLFTFRDPDSRFWFNAQNYADSELQVEQAVERLLLRFSQSGRRVLVVSHFHTGAWMISHLLGEPRAKQIVLRTGAVTHLHQDPSGRFHLVTLNGKPFSGSF